MDDCNQACLQLVDKYSFLTDFDDIAEEDKFKLLDIYKWKDKPPSHSSYISIAAAYEDLVCLNKVNKIVGKISYLNH